MHKEQCQGQDIKDGGWGEVEKERKQMLAKR